MFFSAFVGRKAAKLSLILNLIDPGIGGVLFVGEKGCGKSSLARSASGLLQEGGVLVEVPLNATEEAVTGGVDLDAAIRTGTRTREPGLLTRARGGVLFVDDVNLLGSDVLNLVLGGSSPDAGGTGPGGDGEKLAPGVFLIGTANPEEGAISPHALDRFGLCCGFESLKDKAGRVRVLKRVTAMDGDSERFRRSDRKLREKILAARELMEHVEVPEEIRESIVRHCLEAVVQGHRADIILQRAARAYAALCGSPEVREAHVRKVLSLVLAHRARTVENNDEVKRPRERQDEPEGRGEEEKGGERDEGESGGSEGSEHKGDEAPPFAGSDREGNNREEVFAPGDPFQVRRITFRKDRLERRESGRRTRTAFAGKGGRYVKSTIRPRENDIAVDAVLRAAAPWQRQRGRTGNLIILDEDMRYRRREKKMGHLVVFVVDCSGSMGARKRMVETKGALLSLLMDCYHKRDKVSLIAFRKDRAEVVLPPTASVELAARRLEALPVGGKTPLGAGLLAAYNLVRSARFKAHHTRFLVVVVSDGRANHGLSGMPVREEIGNCCGLLNELPQTDYIVVDTEEKSGFMHADLACDLAAKLGAAYFATNDLKAEYLSQIVRAGALALDG